MCVSVLVQAVCVCVCTASCGEGEKDELCANECLGFAQECVCMPVGGYLGH